MKYALLFDSVKPFESLTLYMVRHRDAPGSEGLVTYVSKDGWALVSWFSPTSGDQVSVAMHQLDELIDLEDVQGVEDFG